MQVLLKSLKQLYLRGKSQETQTACISVDSFCSCITGNQLYIVDIFSMKTNYKLY